MFLKKEKMVAGGLVALMALVEGAGRGYASLRILCGRRRQ